MRITPIALPLPGEHVATTFPIIRPEAEEARWRLRLEFWAGRSLTAEALEIEQEHRAAHLAWRGRAATPGIVTGLEVALEPPATPPAVFGPAGHFVHVLPGHGFLPDGEDVVVPRPLRVPLEDLPVHYVRVGGSNQSPAEPVPSGAVAGVPRAAGGFVFAVDRFDAAHDFWAAVLLLCPAEMRTFARVDPHDPCELDPSRDAFADERRLDAVVLRLCQLPARWEPEFPDRDDAQWRNRLAHAILREEARMSARQQIRFLEEQREASRWDTVLREAQLFPWHLLGLPLALVSSERVPDAAIRTYFLDRASVARPGGLPRPRTRPAIRLATGDTDAALDPPGAGTPSTWRARVDQFAEHIGAFDARTADDVTALASRFRFVPPAGFLPRAALELLTTAQALAAPTMPDQPPDRAGIDYFFPPAFSVEAVPVSFEDLDAALAASAPLAELDLASATPDLVRILVPLPQRIFDPHLLVVALEDPVFAATVARFAAVRQDWRQRRDAVRRRRNVLLNLTAGPLSAPPVPPLDPGQLEPEPVETLAEFTAAGFTGALLSPAATAGPWEARVTFATAQEVPDAATLFVQVRPDQEAMPDRIEVRWRTPSGEVPVAWTEPPWASHPPTDDQGDPVATPLWFRFPAQADRLGVAGLTIEGFTIHVANGRVGLLAAGELHAGEGDDTVETVWWHAQDTAQAPQFTGGDWERISGEQLLAPFEGTFLAAFPDGRSEPARIEDVNRALNPEGVTERPGGAVRVETHGLERALAELEAEASEADDFIDTYFTRAQVNLYRIRKLVLGETAAQKLLVNPAIALIAEQETATASAEEFSAFITSAKARAVPFAGVNLALAPPAITSITPLSGARGAAVSATIAGRNLTNVTSVAFSGAGISAAITGRTPPDAQGIASLAVTITIAADAAPGGRTVTLHAEVQSGQAVGRASSEPFSSFTVTSAAPAVPAGLRTFFGNVTPISFVSPSREFTLTTALAPSEAKLDTLKGVFGQRPETGPTLPPRGLSIGQRFVEPPATQNLSYARAALVQFLDQLPRLRLPLVGQTVRSISGEDVPLIELQGRRVPGTGTTADAIRTAAVNRLLTVAALTADTDEAEVTLAALDFTEVKSAILRTIERVAQQHRTVVQNGTETLRLLSAQRDAAGARVLVLDGRLDEARHDVSVAQALRQEEQRRVTAVNDRRDRIVRDEVTFLAYVRPRAVEPVHRNVPFWKLEPFGVAAPVPACLQRHDEPPPALNAYVQLLRHAPARWFTALQPLLARLDTPGKLVALLEETRVSAASFAAVDMANAVRGSAEAVQLTVLSAHQAIASLRQRSAAIPIGDKRGLRWQDVLRDAEEHASVGDLLAGKHGSRDVSSAAALEIEQIGRVATCLHAEFAAVPPAIRLAWIERFGQFDRPVFLRDLTVLPQYARLDRATRRRLQEFADWLFGRVHAAQNDAMALINDLLRLSLLLASHAPVNRIIAGHVPRPTSVRPGIRIPIRPLNPELVRIGMEVQVWQASRVVARGLVEDLQEGEVSARVDTVQAQTTTIDTTMRVQFVPAALSLFGAPPADPRKK